jgi:hypothetical protein
MVDRIRYWHYPPPWWKQQDGNWFECRQEYCSRQEDEIWREDMLNKFLEGIAEAAAKQQARWREDNARLREASKLRWQAWGLKHESKPRKPQVGADIGVGVPAPVFFDSRPEVCTDVASSVARSVGGPVVCSGGASDVGSEDCSVVCSGGDNVCGLLESEGEDMCSRLCVDARFEGCQCSVVCACEVSLCLDDTVCGDGQVDVSSVCDESQCGVLYNHGGGGVNEYSENYVYECFGRLTDVLSVVHREGGGQEYSPDPGSGGDGVHVGTGASAHVLCFDDDTSVCSGGGGDRESLYSEGCISGNVLEQECIYEYSNECASACSGDDTESMYSFSGGSDRVSLCSADYDRVLRVGDDVYECGYDPRYSSEHGSVRDDGDGVSVCTDDLHAEANIMREDGDVSVYSNDCASVCYNEYGDEVDAYSDDCASVCYDEYGDEADAYADQEEYEGSVYDECVSECNTICASVCSEGYTDELDACANQE